MFVRLLNVLVCVHLDFESFARIYSSDSAEIEENTNGGDLAYIANLNIDLRDVESFKRNSRNPPSWGFYTGLTYLIILIPCYSDFFSCRLQDRD